MKYFIYPFLFCIVLFSCTNQENDISFDKDVRVILREIGHQLLISNNDSTSIIKPIQKTKSNEFKIIFQKEISIQPDSLVSIIKNNFKKIQISKNYLVEVIECDTQLVAYSYKIQETKENDIVPCKARTLPKKCYFIQIEFLDKIVKKSNSTYIIYTIVLLILVIFIFYKKKKSPIKADLDIVFIGKFQFDIKQSKLINNTKELNLSKKENEILKILLDNKNQIVTREFLTKKVWEDNGVVVGRSLDTYISKLRKKLTEDSNAKIINIHGVGYKLEV